MAVDDDLWSAIGDPTRRRMLDLLLADGDGTATTLGRQLPVTRQAVAKHLSVLDRAGLVRAAPQGPPAIYQHESCGGPVKLHLNCAECGAELEQDQVGARPGPGAQAA